MRDNTSFRYGNAKSHGSPGAAVDWGSEDEKRFSRKMDKPHTSSYGSFAPGLTNEPGAAYLEPSWNSAAALKRFRQERIEVCTNMEAISDRGKRRIGRQTRFS